MENRLIFFASPAEQQEGAEVSQTETDPDGNLKKAGADLAQLENLKAKPGGTKAASEARGLIDRPGTSDFVKELLKKKITAVEAAAGARKNKLTPEATTALNKAVADLEKTVKFQKERIADNASADSEFGRLASLSNADELFKDVKVSVESKSKGGTVELKWLGKDLGKFRQLGLPQKRAMLKALNDKLFNKSPEGSKAVESMRDSFLSNKDVPESWKPWLKKPEAGFPGATDKQKTLEYVVDWVNKNLGPLVIQAEKFKSISAQADASPQAAKQLSEKGVKTSLENFRNLSRTERNDVLKNYAEVLASTDADLAKRAAEAGVSDSAGTEHVQAKNTAEIAKAKKETSVQAEQLSAKLQDFASSQKLSQKAAARERELAEAGKEAGTADQVANLRQRAQAGESVGLSEKMKNLFRFGKQTAADDYPEAKKEEDFAARARREVASEELENPKNLDELSKSLGLKGVQKEEAAKLAQLLALEKFDVENVRGQLTPEMKALLARRAADDYAEKKAA